MKYDQIEKNMFRNNKRLRTFFVTDESVKKDIFVYLPIGRVT
jgi:hypothetical protein